MREFARAVLATSPLNLDPDAARAAGYADVVAPPTFAVVVQEHTLEQLLAEPDAGIDFSRVVHGDQRFTFTRPIVAGDELTATLNVTSIKSLGGHSMVTAESTIVDATGAHVVTATSTLVVQGRRMTAGIALSRRLTVGDVVAERTFQLTRDTLVRYAGASGDFNPIHYRDDVAAAVGLPGVLAHGMLTMGLAVQPVVDWLRRQRQGPRLPGAVHPPGAGGRRDGAEVTVVAKVGVLDDEAGARIDLTVTFDGETVLGKAQAVVTLAVPSVV